MSEPSEEYQVGPYQLRVVVRETVLVGRMVEYDQTGHTGHAAQAILMVRVFGGSFDVDLLTRFVLQERVQEVYALLRRLAERPPNRRSPTRSCGWPVTGCVGMLSLGQMPVNQKWMAIPEQRMHALMAPVTTTPEWTGDDGYQLGSERTRGNVGRARTGRRAGEARD